MKPNILPIYFLLVFIFFTQNPKSFCQGATKGDGLNIPPVFSNIPEQIIQLGDTFPYINLNSYLTEPNGDDIAYSYIYNNTLTNNESVTWDYTNKSPSMTMLTKIKIRGEYPDANGDRIAAFHDGNLAGEGDARLAGTDWVFFLVIDGEQTYDSIYFQYFDASQSTTFEIKEKVEFISQLNLGDPVNPYVMNAGFVATKEDLIPNSGIFEPEIFNPTWIGADTVYVIAKEVGTTELFSDTTMIIFKVQGQPLPLELVSFTGDAVDFQSILKWKIQHPENVEGYEIQRGVQNSSGHLDWEKIGFVEHDDKINAYRFVDKLPFRNLNYYRLKIKDWDGKFEYSPIINVKFEAIEESAVNIFPNPVKLESNFFISLETEFSTDVNVQIFNQVGQPIRQLQFFTKGNREYFPLDIHHLSSGLYIAKIKVGQQVFARSFVIVEE